MKQYMHQWCNIPTLLQIMACHLFSAQLLPELMLPYCQLDPKKHISIKFYLQFKSFHSRKCTSKCRLPKWPPSCPGVKVLITCSHGKVWFQHQLVRNRCKLILHLKHWNDLFFLTHNAVNIPWWEIDSGLIFTSEDQLCAKLQVLEQ